MKCPLCSASAADDAAECLSCGVIFAKLRARADKPRVADELTPTPPPNPWNGRIAAIALVAVWVVGLGLYYRHELKSRPRRVKAFALEGRSNVSVRDSYGLIGEVPVHVARPGSSAAQAPEPEPPPRDDGPPDPFDE